jgi:hypothetical protein
MSRALVISYYFPPFLGVGAQHPGWFYHYLPDYGVDTYAVSSALYFEGLTGPPIVDPNVDSVPSGAFAQKAARWLYRKEMQVQLRIGYWEPGFVWGRLFGIPAARRMMKQRRFDALVSVSPPISSHWSALRIKRRFPHLRWIADFQDPFLGNPFRIRQSPPGPREKGFEQSLFREADILSANTDTVAEMWRQHYPEYAKKVVVTWGGYDPQESVPRQAAADGPPIMGHIGSLYLGRTPVVFLQTLEKMSRAGKLKTGDLRIEFQGITKLGSLEPVGQYLAEQDIIRIHNGVISREAALDAASRVHYSLLVDITPGHQRLQVPGKLFDQIRLGRPIFAITPQGSPTQRILAQSGIENRCVAPDASPEEYEAAILGMLRIAPASSEPSDWFRDTFDARSLARGLAGHILKDNTG